MIKPDYMIDLDPIEDRFSFWIFFFCRSCGRGISIFELPGFVFHEIGGPRLAYALIQNTDHVCDE